MAPLSLLGSRAMLGRRPFAPPSRRGRSRSSSPGSMRLAWRRRHLSSSPPTPSARYRPSSMRSSQSCRNWTSRGEGGAIDPACVPGAMRQQDTGPRRWQIFRADAEYPASWRPHESTVDAGRCCSSAQPRLPRAWGPPFPTSNPTGLLPTGCFSRSSECRRVAMRGLLGMLSRSRRSHARRDGDALA